MKIDTRADYIHLKKDELCREWCTDTKTELLPGTIESLNDSYRDIGVEYSHKQLYKFDIKIDIDEVLRDTFTQMLSLYNKTFNVDMTSDDITSYNVDKSFPLVKERMNISAYEFFFKSEHTAYVFSGKPIKDIVLAVNTLHTLGHHIIICTNQPSIIGQAKVVDFLNTYEIAYDELHFTADKWRVKSDIIVDDNADFLIDEREQAYCVCINYPHNRDVDISQRGCRFNSFVDFSYALIKGNFDFLSY